KNPADRYASARELADDLRHFVMDEPIRAKRLGMVQRIRKWGRRHRSIVTATVALLLFALTSLAMCTALLASAYEEQTEATRKAQDAERREAKQRRTAERERDLARRHLYDAHMLLAQRCWQDGQVDHLLELLKTHVPEQQAVTDLRGF